MVLSYVQTLLLVHVASIRRRTACSQLGMQTGMHTVMKEPLMQQLSSQRFNGPVEIFMHPVPRGVPILNSIAEITAAVRAARAYLDGLLAS